MANFLAEYEAWVRAERPGLAPSPLPHGLTSGDALREICAIDENVRLESGQSTWQHYAPEEVAKRRAARRKAAG